MNAIWMKDGVITSRGGLHRKKCGSDHMHNPPSVGNSRRHEADDICHRMISSFWILGLIIEQWRIIPCVGGDGFFSHKRFKIQIFGSLIGNMMPSKGSNEQV